MGLDVVLFLLALRVAAATSLVEHTHGRDHDVDKVFVVYSNHFDMGYTKNENGSSAGAVLNQYFHRHIPKAIDTAEAARREGAMEYRWVTQSWVVSAYMFCEETKVGAGPENELRCPSKDAKERTGHAIRQGWITWHAFPFNAEPELFSTELFQAALRLTFRLDSMFGVARKRTLSQRDVPGMTRAVIPLLVENNVTTISVGQNLQCAPVNVPPIFMWKDEPSGTQVLALFHANGYGRRRVLHTTSATSGNSTAMDGPFIDVDAGGKIVASGDHCVKVSAAKVALCLAWKQDNAGPHSYFEARMIHKFVSWLFPNAKVEASKSFDDFADEVRPYQHTLPVVTEEIGDTWIYGATSDPKKVAFFRSATRQHSHCMKQGGETSCLGGSADSSKKKMWAFERLIMSGGEHTWGYEGGPIKFGPWSNNGLERAIATRKIFNTTVGTWMEQRGMLYNALAALLASSPLAKSIRAEWDTIQGPDSRTAFPTSHLQVLDREHDLQCGGFSLRIGDDGSLISVVDKQQREWASVSNPLLRLWYQNMDHQYFERFADDYIYGVSRLVMDLAAENLVKPFLDLEAISSPVRVTKVWGDPSSSSDEIVLEMEIAEKKAHEQRGAPSKFNSKLTCSDDSIDFVLRWFDKKRTRGPETIWLASKPLPSPKKVLLEKLGSMIDAEDCDLGCEGHTYTCGIHLHAVGDEGVSYITHENSSLRFVSLDSAVVSIGSLDPVPTPLVKPNTWNGVHFPLVGNIWNTNYPFWYPFSPEDATSQFRFNLLFA